ncbi:MAG: efflux RND transporter periplasmic adaptor subunit [Deltaproteobacteria bacterium]|nr:efflux RND transporter periplasmic adaptor subunit [Deltaproteobacteria bacterium]
MTKPLRTILVIMAMVLCTAVGVYLIQSVEEPAPPESKPTPVAVEVAKISSRPFTYRLEALGTVEAVREAEVGAQVSGPISRIPADIELGTTVKKGSPLAEIDPTPFEIEVKYRKANVARAKARVRSKEVEIDRQKSLIPLNKEQLRLARAEHGRLMDLLKRDLISKQEAERAELALRRTEEEVEMTESGLREAEVEHAVAEAELASTQAELARAEESLADTRVLAPFAGVITEKSVTLGEQVSPGKVLFRLAEIDKVKLLLRIPPDDIEFIRRGTAADVSINVSPQVFQGKVAYIGPRADDETRSFPVEVLVENSGPMRLLPGMFARARIPVRTFSNAILVPRSSVLTDSGKPVAFVVNTDRKVAEQKSVTIARTFGSRYLITDGLKDGELLVISGQALLRNNAAIRVVGTRNIEHEKAG